MSGVMSEGLLFLINKNIKPGLVFLDSTKAQFLAKQMHKSKGLITS